MMMPGTEWIVDAHGCNAEALRSVRTLEALFGRIIEELQLRPVNAPIWHQFPGEGGVTGVVLLSESHLSVHTFPESGFAAINLYCCRPRQPWTWEPGLAQLLGAQRVQVRVACRGSTTNSEQRATNSELRATSAERRTTNAEL
jgi:S-adenosylmethionine decarboxylase